MEFVYRTAMDLPDVAKSIFREAACKPPRLCRLGRMGL